MLPGPPIIYGAQPVSVSLARRLHIGTSLTSPMVAGRFRAGNDGAATGRGRDGGSPDLGALQTYRGLIAGPTGVRIGAQGGPSDQPGYPGTGNSVLNGLAAMDRPDIQRYGGLR